MLSRLYSAVVDPVGVFPLQARHLVWSLTELAGVSPQQIILHVVNSDADPEVLTQLRQLGVEVVVVDAYSGHPYCNKLQQLPSLAAREFDEVVLLDCDVLVIEEPPTANGSASGKPVDFANPDFAVLEKLFAEAGLTLTPAVADINGGRTALGNVNGGVYILSRPVFEPLATEWRKWADWCLGRRDVFGEQWMHVDQVSFAMAVSSLGTPFTELERRFNTPTHVPQPLELDCDPAILHYHRAVCDQFLLLPVDGLPQVNKAIETVNRRLLEYRRAEFDNTAFWNARYVLNPELGSGFGSRGEILAGKQQLLVNVVKLLEVATVADVGGGDGQTMSVLPPEVAIHAVDVAASARSLYMEANLRATWMQHNISEAPVEVEADLVVCFDVLIHLSNPGQYKAAVKNLLASRKPVLVSGFDDQPVVTGPMTYFHQSLSESIAAGGFVAIPVGAYRGLTAFVALPPQPAVANRDISDHTLIDAIPLVDDPLLLLEALTVSRAKLGFFPDHLPRCIEYPWIVQRLDGREPLRIVEAGAGVSVLPFLLANRGHSVITADPHTTRRNETPRDSWNEWGFLDYSKLDHRIQSVNIPYQNVELDWPIGAVISVSVIEHLTREVRRAWISKAYNQLNKGGSILLTVDTVPFTRNLWNYSEGREVEDRAIHGTLDTMLAELCDAGFDIVIAEHSQWLPKSRVGMARIEARKPNRDAHVSAVFKESQQTAGWLRMLKRFGLG